MPEDTWTFLPLPVWDLILRQNFSITDLHNVRLVCHRWNEVVTRKIPHSVGVLSRGIQAVRQRRTVRRLNVLSDCLWRAIVVTPGAVMATWWGLVGLLHVAPLLGTATLRSCPNWSTVAASLLLVCTLWLLMAISLIAVVFVPLLDRCSCAGRVVLGVLRLVLWLVIVGVILFALRGCVGTLSVLSTAIGSYHRSSLSFNFAAFSLEIFDGMHRFSCERSEFDASWLRSSSPRSLRHALGGGY
jgi:hypothetical protein